MKGIRALLNRIRWAPEEGRACKDYVIGYRDKEEEREIAFEAVDQIDNFGFSTHDGIHIPFHRIRHVRKGKETIWRRGGLEKGL